MEKESRIWQSEGLSTKSKRERGGMDPIFGITSNWNAKNASYFGEKSILIAQYSRDIPTYTNISYWNLYSGGLVNTGN